jgi:hypothetical protein
MADGPGDLAVIASLLADRARLLAAQVPADGTGNGTSHYRTVGAHEGTPALAMVRLAEELRTLAGDALRLAVQCAHASGHTWQEIGDPLGISPQAAFQRFGRPDGPAAGEPTTREPAAPLITDAADRAITVLADWFEGNYDAVAATFDATLAESFPVAGLAAARTHLAGTAGQYQRLGDREPLLRQVGDYTLADVPLVFETGVLKGRVAFDRAGQVVGLYVLPPATP